MFRKIPLCSHPVLDFCLLEFLNYKCSFTTGDWFVQIIYFLDSILTYCMFLEICPFLLGYPINWHLTHGSILRFFFCCLFFVLYLYGISICISTVSPLSVLILFGSSLFFLVSLDKCLSILCFQKN